MVGAVVGAGEPDVHPFAAGLACASTSCSRAPLQRAVETA